MSYIISGIAFILILGAAVVIHEFGHFLVAKLLGIRVETFSVGFGKRLWGRRWGTTDYRLSLIPPSKSRCGRRCSASSPAR